MADSEIRFPRRRSHRERAIQELYWPTRERSWALRTLGRFVIDDATKLVARSEELIARSRRLIFRLD